MISDFNQLDSQSELRADVCIIGGGAAGITLALELAGSRAKVILLEGGGLEYDDATQELYAGENVGRPYDVRNSRLRFLGGTTNHWEGVCGPLDDIDFQKRSWLPHSGWPINRSDLMPYYEKAQAVCRLGPFRYGEDVWTYIERKGLSIDPEKLHYGFRQFRDFPIRFGEEYGDELERAQSVNVILQANATNIQLADDGRRVERLDVKSLQGKSARITARYFVMACGGIENARLLLVSNSVEAKGIGNRHDVVGRFFQDHAQLRVGELFPTDERRFRSAFLQEFVEGIRFAQHLSLAPRVQEREQVLDSMAYPVGVIKADTGMAAARDLMRAIRGSRNGSLKDWDRKVWRLLMDLDDVAVNAYRRLVLGKGTLPPIERIELKMESAQAPNPESRVTLTREKDALGLNRARLNWRFTDMERRSVLALGKTLAAEFGRLGVARVKLDEEILREGGPLSGNYGYHHIGTTRMSDDPREGVVDRDCRMHGVENLYVAGSSVFPTAGHMNPTLTIVALAIRLGELLKSKLS